MVAGSGSRARRLLRMLRDGEFGPAARTVRKVMWSTAEEYGLRGELPLPEPPEAGQFRLEVRPVEPTDVERLVGDEASSSSLHSWRLRRLVDAGVPGGWVAVDGDGRPCFVLWVIGPENNERLRREIGPTFRPLGPGEVLLASGFTPSPHRGVRMGEAAGKKILDIACPEARWAWAYTSTTNRAALISLVRAGFTPVVRMRSKWRFLRQTVDFEPLPAGAQVLGRDSRSAG